MIETKEKVVADLIQLHGSLPDIPWTTLDGREMTLGTMTDDHLDNAINHHEHIIGSSKWVDLVERCEYTTFLLTQEHNRRNQKVTI